MINARSLLAVGLALGVLPLARAEEAFTLGKYVPADSVVYVHGAHNPKSEFICKHWAEVFEAVRTAGIDQEIKNLALSKLEDPQQKASFSQTWDGMVRRLGDVRWGELTSREFAFYLRINPIVELGVLMRPTPESLEQNVTALTELLKTLAALRPEPLPVNEARIGEATVWSLGVEGASLALVRQGEVVGLIAGQMGAQSCAQMLADAGGATSIAQSSRLRQALEQLPQPEDTVVFVDFRAALGTVRNLLGGMMPPAGAEQPEDLKLIASVLEQFDVVDYLASVQRTEGQAYFTHERVQLQEGAAAKPVVRAFTANQPIEDYARFVPATAKGFSASSGIDLSIMYQAALDFVRDKVPDGPEHLKAWDAKQTEVGFNLSQDVLSWLDGRVLRVDLPPAIQTGMSGNDFVFFVKAKDAQRAIKNIDGWLDRANALLGQGGALMIMPAADVKAEGFKSVTHPMVAMMLTLTYGMHEDWLVLGNSTAAINKCLETARGEGARFVDGERFKKEGLAVSGPADVQFSDLSNLGQEASMSLQMIQMVNMFLPVGPGMAPVRSIFGILSKLAPAAARLDFMLSQCSATQRQGNGWTTVTKMTYREYDPNRRKAPGEKTKKSVDGL